MLDQLFFYLFSAIILVSAVFVIYCRNAVHSAIFLITTLLGVAGIFLHLRAEFLAGVHVIIYVGGIMVLFLFVIMLVNLDQAAREARFSGQWTLGLTAVLLLAAELGYGVYKGGPDFRVPQAPAIPGLGNTQEIGMVLFRKYMMPFEIASILLLVAMVGAVVMAKKRI